MAGQGTAAVRAHTTWMHLIHFFCSWLFVFFFLFYFILQDNELLA